MAEQLNRIYRWSQRGVFVEENKKWRVRYQVKDVARSVAFYTAHLGFTSAAPTGGERRDPDESPHDP